MAVGSQPATKSTTTYSSWRSSAFHHCGKQQFRIKFLRTAMTWHGIPGFEEIGYLAGCITHSTPLRFALLTMPKILITPGNNPFRVDFRELLRYRELLLTLAWRDLRVKYAQTAIGFAWAIVNPLFALLVLTFVFGTVAGVDVGTDHRGVPIPHLVYTVVGLAGWTYFSEVFSQAGSSIVQAQQMVQKIYFPRLIIPISKALTALVDLCINFVLVAALMLWYGVAPSGNIIYLPLFVFAAIVSGLASGLWMSALTVRFRDFQYITPMLLRVGMYITPIAYPAAAVPDKYQMLYYLNPVAGVVEGMRWCMLSGSPLSDHVWVSFSLLAVLAVSGLLYFNRVEKIMPDIL